MTKNSFNLRAYFLFALARISYIFFWVFSAIFIFLKWSIAPFIFIIQILFVLPFVKFKLTVNQKINPQDASQEDLTDETWEIFQEQKELLEQEGFIGTKLFFVDIIDGTTRNYIYPMVNENQKLGMGLNYMLNKDAKDEFTILDMAFMEFTLHCQNGNTIDIHNHPEDILGDIKHRKRYYLRQNDPQRMFQIVRTIAQKSNCFTSKESLESLKNYPNQIIKEEIELGLKALEENGITYKLNDKSKLSWRGACTVIFQSLWPMKVWFEKKNHQKGEQYLKDLGIDIQNIPYDDYSIKEKIYKPVTTLEELHDVLQKPKFYFGFSKNHKPTSIVFYMDETYQTTSIVVNMFEIKKHGNKDRYSTSNYQIEFNNVDLQGSYDGYIEKNYYTKYCPFEKPLDDLNLYIDINKVLKLSQEKLKIEKPEFTTLSLLMDENRALWEACFQKEDRYQSIELDAQSGEILSSGTVKNL